MGAPASAKLLVIGDKTFAIGTLPASVAIDVECIVAQAIGEALFRLLVAKDETEEQQSAAALQAVGALAKNLDSAEVKKLMGLAFSVVTVGDGVGPATPINFDQTFTGHPKMPWEVLIEALKVNFADFFPAGLSTSLASSIRTLQK